MSRLEWIRAVLLAPLLALFGARPKSAPSEDLPLSICVDERGRIQYISLVRTDAVPSPVYRFRDRNERSSVDIPAEMFVDWRMFE